MATILIIIMLNGGVAMQEFDTPKACRYAMDEAKRMRDDWRGSHIICVPKNL